MEIWKKVVGYEGIYEVSNMGRIKRLQKLVETVSKDMREGGRAQGEYKHSRLLPDRILKGIYSDKGYLTVGLTKDGKSKKVKIHRVVAIAFIVNPENKPEVNHLDGNKQNNRLDNLEWVTGEENVKHAIEMGLTNKFPDGKLTDIDKQWILDNIVVGSRTHGIMSMVKKYEVRADTIKRLIRNNA